MALKTKNLIVKNQPEQNVIEEDFHSDKNENLNRIENKIDILMNRNENKYNFDENKFYIVFNGKVKEISPKSKYILDMLIIDEE